MKVLVCDDEPLARDRLSRLLARIDGCEVVGEAHNGRDAVAKVGQLLPDLVLMDIQMPDMTGIEAAEHISKSAKPPAIIFCTAYNEYAVQAFQVHAVGYLLKPVRQEDLSHALEQARSLNKLQLQAIKAGGGASQNGAGERAHISAKTHRGIQLIPIADVRYFKADQKYVVVRYTGGEVLVDDTLKDFETELGDNFIRVHRNALVSLRHIASLNTLSAGHYQITLKDIDEPVPVSRRHVPSLRKLLKSL